MRDRVRAWIAADPDPTTRAQLSDLLERADGPDGRDGPDGPDGADPDGRADAIAELADRFSGRLSFGTAGLRAELGAGPMRMNRLVVRHAAAGLMRVLRPGASVVIGYDARHQSDEFARETARVVAGAGGTALVLPGRAPTPLLAFAVRHLGADAGVMCTASHNPARDNGYKVYGADGAQVIPPVDAAIAAAAAAAADEGISPLADDTGNADASDGTDDAIARDAIVVLGPEVLDAYLAHVAALVRPGPRDVAIVHTAMHGVGRDAAMAAFDRAGFRPVHQVAEQSEPDPDFPTVAFPNPEEPGALDLALAAARRVQADVVLAHDPDADRLGVAVPTAGCGDDPSGWHTLTGNEVGALLADHVLSTTTGDERLVATTFVSSQLLARMAAAHGVHYAEVPTGFKWIVRPGIEHPEWRFVFGFEEALGFSVDAFVRDKDGISAALVFAELVAARKAEGRTVWDTLERLSREHGYHASRTWSMRWSGRGAAEQLHAIVSRWRSQPPTELAGHRVERVVDLADAEGPLATDAVVLLLEGGTRVVARPSGTEPKVKLYLEAVEPVGPGPDAYLQARRRGDASLEELRLAVADDLGLHP